MDWGLLERRGDVSSLSYYYFYGEKGNQSWLWWWPYSLRSRRLYRSKWVYYVIFGINFCLRFVGMMTLIPPVYLSRSTGLIVNTYNDPDFQVFVGSLVACAEIFRRTLWALLRLEWEIIKISPQGRSAEMNKDVTVMENGNGATDSHILLDVERMKPMAISASEYLDGQRGFSLKAWPSAVKENFSFAALSDMTNLNGIQVLSELCVWATIFSGIAIIAAAHREVL